MKILKWTKTNGPITGKVYRAFMPKVEVGTEVQVLPETGPYKTAFGVVTGQVTDEKYTHTPYGDGKSPVDFAKGFVEIEITESNWD